MILRGGGGSMDDRKTLHSSLRESIDLRRRTEKTLQQSSINFRHGYTHKIMLSLEQHINTPSTTMMTLKATVVTPWTFDRSVTVDQDTTDTSSSSAGDDSVHNNSTHQPKVVSFTPTPNCNFKDRKFVTRSQLHLPEGKGSLH